MLQKMCPMKRLTLKYILIQMLLKYPKIKSRNLVNKLARFRFLIAGGFISLSGTKTTKGEL
jgi:hypothetical protein